MKIHVHATWKRASDGKSARKLYIDMGKANGQKTECREILRHKWLGRAQCSPLSRHKFLFKTCRCRMYREIDGAKSTIYRAQRPCPESIQETHAKWNWQTGRW
eukprot:gnl/TRDRNA2_/TRDRNA2_176709_c8_seq4.p2 gnl/TRDRNA2_/TRDRNA2_176709_c8~~gnl/TRDRNA2_/TRDRNA2_176709_c8_seq4.p2  ORF type:complete len:103 (-),score=5.00 gnl/TRDRNA2_/TRDRNA2_176709_c8_seq4:289-597(-)